MHGEFSKLSKLVELYEDNSDYIVLVGDVGLGFDPKYSNIHLPDKVKFIRGNHDSPEICKSHPNYLGDFGYHPDMDLFYISGAASIDKGYRIEGVSWWRDEELNYSQLQQCSELYKQTKPRIVVSHDVPSFVQPYILNAAQYPSRTASALEFMFREYNPRYWVCGHYHTDFKKNILNTSFVCVPELGIFQLQEKE